LADTPEPFDALLAWLNPDRELAAQKYETIRAGLIRIFVAKGFSDAEDLADDTITRVTRRLPEIIGDYEGEPARYFHGVARHVILENYRRKEIALEVSPVSWLAPSPRSDEYECLMRCLQFLADEKRELIVDYYVYEGHDKIEHHKMMAHELSISTGALRGRAHHIRTALEQCVLECVANLTKQTKGVAGDILDSGAVPQSVSHGPNRST
jgi:DNA-directed RNA polymerase specialized sigma24 family protein